MVKDQIEARGVKDPLVLAAMQKVKRHLFVPERLHGEAYGDFPLPIGQGQTISQPYIVASMTELLRPEKDHVILEVGTGSGYQAAVLAEIVKQVYTIEIVPALGERAAKLLKDLGYTHVTAKVGDGYLGWKEHAPFDGIVVTAAATEIPQPLLDQLKPGGRLVIPVGAAGEIQELLVVEKGMDGKIEKKTQYPVRFVPLIRH